MRSSKIKIQMPTIRNPRIWDPEFGFWSSNGFTLLEVLVALAILGIAVVVVFQLFSADLRAISVSGDYVTAASRAEAKMREILTDDNLSEKSWTETTDDGYVVEASVSKVMEKRTENLQVEMLEIDVTLKWASGSKDKSITLKTMKVIEKKV